MPRIQKLKQNIDFRRAYGRGKSFSEPALVTYVLKNNRAGVEIYSSNRFFLVTGEKLIYSEIIENQQAIDYIVDKFWYAHHEEMIILVDNFAKDLL